MRKETTMNQLEMAKKAKDYMDKLAQGISEGIVSYLNSLQS